MGFCYICEYLCADIVKEEGEMVDVGSIKGVRVFDGLGDDALESIANICGEQKFKKGDIAIKQGDVDEAISVLVKGELQTEIEIPGFKESIPVYTFESNEVFGELAFISSAPRSATIKCLDNAEIVNLDRTKFDKLCKKDPDIERVVMKNLAILLSERLRDTTIQLRDGLSKLPSKVVSRKARSVFSELSDWVNTMKGISSV